MPNTLFSSWPCFTQEEADAISRVLFSNHVNYWTGDECKTFDGVMMAIVNNEIRLNIKPTID